MHSLRAQKIDFAQYVKVYAAAREGEQRYSPAVVVDSVKLPIYGYPVPERICTSQIEHSNPTMRMHIRRLTRLTNGFPEKWANLKRLSRSTSRGTIPVACINLESDASDGSRIDKSNLGLCRIACCVNRSAGKIKMLISRDEAESLFRKWKDKQAVISLVVNIGAVRGSATGLLTFVENDFVVVASPSSQLRILLAGASFNYEGVREGPEAATETDLEFVAGLHLNFKFGECIFAELEPRTTHN